MLDLGALKWEEINPDIFGLDVPGHRHARGAGLGPRAALHLRAEHPQNSRACSSTASKSSSTPVSTAPELEALLERIGEIKVFDPRAVQTTFWSSLYRSCAGWSTRSSNASPTSVSKHQVLYAVSKINIESFYGIEIDDFAVEVAILSLWIAKAR